MSLLLTFLANLWKGFGWSVGETWRLFKEYGALIVAIVTAVLTLALPIADLVLKVLRYALEQIDRMVLPAFDFEIPSGATDVFALANTFFPLDEFCSYFLAYMTFYIVMTLYRIARSFIPSIAGTGLPNG